MQNQKFEWIKVEIQVLKYRLCALTLTTVVAHQTAAESLRFTSIAISNTPVFGSSTLRWSNNDHFRGPTINQHGDIAFRGGTYEISQPALDRAGVFRWNNSGGHHIMSVGDPVPGFPGKTFGSPSLPVIGDDGSVAFTGAFQFGGGVGLFRWNGISTNIVALSGISGPPGSTYPSQLGNLDTPLLSPTGHIGFVESVGNFKQIWTGTPDSVSLQLASLSQPQGFPTGTTISQYAGTRFVQNGATVSKAILSIPGTAQTDCLVLGTSNGPTVLVGPGIRTGSEGTFEGHISRPNVNHYGQLGFTAGYRPTPGADIAHAAWLGDVNSNEFTRIAQVGDVAPGLPTGYTLAGFAAPIIASNGEVLFHGWANGPGNQLGGFWRLKNDQLLLTVRSYDDVAGAAAGAKFISLAGGNGGNDVAFNALGQMAFMGRIAIPGSSQKTALLVADADSGLQALAIVSELFEVQPGDFRTVAQIKVWNSRLSGPTLGLNGSDGYGTYLNDSGQLTFGLLFTDGTSGIFVTQIPTPPAALYLVACTLLIRSRRRQADSTLLDAGYTNSPLRHCVICGHRKALSGHHL